MTRPEVIHRSAHISDCGKYRYALTRSLLFGAGTVNFIMLNPSTADAEVDDPTIRRCIGFANDWGYEKLVVTNLFALRSTNPDALARAADPIGPKNEQAIFDNAYGSEMVVCAWGVGGRLNDRGLSVRRKLWSFCEPHVLRLTASGHPSHPLYLPALLRPVEWRISR